MEEEPDNIMENLPHYREKYDAAKTIHVYYVPAIDENTGKAIYFYAIANELLHDEMMHSLSHGDIPYFAVVVEKGEGIPPTDEVKAKIKSFYGFDHDQLAADTREKPTSSVCGD